jgi:hypothetical protein
MSKHSKLQRELLDIQNPTYSRNAEKEIKKWKTLNSRKSKQIKNLIAATAATAATAPPAAPVPVIKKPMSGLGENLLSDMEIRLSGFENWIVDDLLGDEIKIPGRALPELSRLFPGWQSRV